MLAVLGPPLRTRTAPIPTGSSRSKVASSSRARAAAARRRYLDSSLRCLRDAGFRSDLLDQAFHTIENHVFGHAMQAQGLPLDREQMAQLILDGLDHLRDPA